MEEGEIVGEGEEGEMEEGARMETKQSSWRSRKRPGQSDWSQQQYQEYQYVRVVCNMIYTAHLPPSPPPSPPPCFPLSSLSIPPPPTPTLLPGK